MKVFMVCLSLLPALVFAQKMELELVSTNEAKQVKLGWNAQPGQTYNIMQAGSLKGGAWSNATLDGVYAPTVIGQTSINTGAKSAFFKLMKEDTDPPIITNRIPRVDGVDVSLSNSVSLWLSDETAIDPASILLHVGACSNLTINSSGVSYSNNVFSFESPGDFGVYGEVITNFLTVADTLGHTLTNIWSFTLERQAVQKTGFFPLVAPPDSLMKLSATGTVLPRNIPGIQPLAGQETYEVVDVTSNSVVFAYDRVIPTVTNGTILVSFDAAHIFYRKVSSDMMMINTATHRISVITTNIPLSVLISEGSLSTMDLIPVDGGVQPLFAGESDVLDFNFDNDLSGTVIYENSNVKIWLPSAMWSFTGGVDVYMDFSEGELNALTVDTDSEFNSYVDAEVLFYAGYGNSCSKELGSFSRLYMAMLGTVPVSVLIKGEVNAVAELNASVEGSVNAVVGAKKQIGFELDYKNGEWSRRFDDPPIDFYALTLDFDINGAAHAKVYVQPKLTVLVYGVAGPWVDVRPYLEADCSCSLDEYEHALYYGISANMGVDSIVFNPDIEWQLFNIRESLYYETSMPDVAPKFAASLSDCTIEEGQNLTLSTPAIGKPVPTYCWYFNGKYIPGVSGAQYHITSANSGHVGEYKVIASNSEGSTETSCRVTVSQGWAPAGMVCIPGGTNSGTDPDYGYYSLTVNTFYMDATEVTNDEMVRVMQWAYDNGRLIVSSSSVKNAQGNLHEQLLDLDFNDCRITWSGSSFEIKSEKGIGFPCEAVTWYGAAAYCNYLSEMEERTPCYDLSTWNCDFTVNGYRLPTKDEWEYAARGGLSGKRFPWGDTISHSQANYYSAWIGETPYYPYDLSTTCCYHPDYDDVWNPCTSPVGAFVPNGYGLYDMAGNVKEWCNNMSGSLRYLRNGCWDTEANRLCCGYGVWAEPFNSWEGFGFRIVCR